MSNKQSSLRSGLVPVGRRPGVRATGRSTTRAKPLHRQLVMLGTEAPRQSDHRVRGKFIQAQHGATALTLEMRMGTLVGMAGGIEAPHPVIPRNTVRQSLRGQPVQHAVDRHAVDVDAAVDAFFQFMVTQRLLGGEQGRQHLDPRPRQPRAGAADQRIRLKVMAFGGTRGVRGHGAIATQPGH